MKGDITIKSVVLLLLLPTILYTVVIITLFIGIPQPTMRDMPSRNRATVQVDTCNRLITKMKIFKRRAVKRNKKKKKKKRCPKNEKKKQFSVRVAGYATYTYKKYVKSIGG